VKQTHNPPAQPLPKGHYGDRVEHAATPTSHIGFAAALRSVSHRVGVRGPTELSRLAKTSLRLTKSHWGEGRLPSERTFEQYVAAIQERARCCAYEIEPDRYDDGMGFLFEITEPLAAMHRAYYAEASVTLQHGWIGTEEVLAWPWFSWCVEHDQPLPLDTKGRIRVAVDVRGGYLDIITLLEAKNVHQEMLCIVRATGAWRSRSVSSTRLIPKRSFACTSRLRLGAPKLRNQSQNQRNSYPAPSARCCTSRRQARGRADLSFVCGATGATRKRAAKPLAGVGCLG